MGKNMPFLLSVLRVWKLREIMRPPIPTSWCEVGKSLLMAGLFFKLNWFTESKNLRTTSIQNPSLPVFHSS